MAMAVLQSFVVCPKCKSQIVQHQESLECESCHERYSRHAGIPDFRVFPDPYLSFEEDRERTEIVLRALEDHDFRSLLEHYWSFSDITPEALRPKYVESALQAVAKSQQVVRRIQERTNHLEKPIRVLDLGSGTGSFLFAAANEFGQLVGADIAMRWLHLSRRRFMDAEMPVPELINCCAECLPFADDSFEVVVATAMLEFANDPERVLAECARVLCKKNGVLVIETVNRFSLAPEPHVFLWGVGFLPRNWQARYVRWRVGASYENVHLRSFGELKSMAARYFGKQEFRNLDVDDKATQNWSWIKRKMLGVYRGAKKLPLLSSILQRLGPGWEITLTAPVQQQNPGASHAAS